MAKAQTILKFIGGINKDRIGGNCSVIEHTDELGNTDSIMCDLGSIFTPIESGFIAAYPNVDDYFDRTDIKTGEFIPALRPVKALFITHAHEDHIGALINYVKMGYHLPPIKASGFTRNFIRLAFKNEGLALPQIDKVKAGENIKISDNMIVEAVDVSHSIVDSLGFHTLTYVKGKPYAAIMNNGDFLTEEEVPVGQAFNNEKYLGVFKRKKSPTTVICLDSTSTVPNGGERIGFEKAVENTYKAVLRNPDREMIVSPVISRSIQNIAIDIEVARRLGTKVYLDGKWLQTVKEAMSLSGYQNFDDVVYKGTLPAYMSDKHLNKRYIVCTGAFAQGLENYEYNLGINETSPIALSSASKMALDLHPQIRMGKDVLVLARQRIIEEINGNSGPKMLQMMAAQGAKIIMTPCGHQVGDFEEVQMQDSGHINAKAMASFMAGVKSMVPNVIAVPIHGNPEQCLNTKDIMNSVGVKTHLSGNSESLEIGNGQVRNVEPKITPQTWYAVKLVMPSLGCERDIPAEGLREFWEVSETYQPIRKICEVDNVHRFKPKDGGYMCTVDTDVLEDLPLREPVSKNKRKLPRKLKKALSKREGR